MRDFSIVVAATADSMGIGRDGQLPWKLPGDMAFFKRETLRSSTATVATSTNGDTASTAPVLRNAVIMGRKTYESIPTKFRPLQGRLNIILTRNANLTTELCLPPDVLVAGSLEEALSLLSSPERLAEIEHVYVIGGGGVYAEAVKSPFCSTIHLTSVEQTISDCDTFFPCVPANRFKLSYYSDVQEEGGTQYRFTRYERLTQTFLSRVPASAVGNPEEQQYLDAVKDILENGVQRGDRTGKQSRVRTRCICVCVRTSTSNPL